MSSSSCINLDVSQPSLGAENEQPDRLTTPPLSPMYSSDGQSVHVSVSSKGGKTQVVYIKPSSATSMETHWEEAIQCTHPEKRYTMYASNKIADALLEAETDDTESELIVIPESDMSDSTLQDSVQDSFDETTDDLCCPYAKTEKSCSFLKKDQSSRSIQHKRPTWIIGSEEESLKSVESKSYTLQEVSKHENGTQVNRSCPKVTNLAGVPAKTVTTDSHRQVTCYSVDTHHAGKPTLIGKQKKIIEPCITPASTPVSDCEECLRSQSQMLPVPTMERLLPIGAARQPGRYTFSQSNVKVCKEILCRNVKGNHVHTPYGLSIGNTKSRKAFADRPIQ